MAERYQEVAYQLYGGFEEIAGDDNLSDDVLRQCWDEHVRAINARVQDEPWVGGKLDRDGNLVSDQEQGFDDIEEEHSRETSNPRSASCSPRRSRSMRP